MQCPAMQRLRNEVYEEITHAVPDYDTLTLKNILQKSLGG